MLLSTATDLLHRLYFSIHCEHLLRRISLVIFWAINSKRKLLTWAVLTRSLLLQRFDGRQLPWNLISTISWGKNLMIDLLLQLMRYRYRHNLSAVSLTFQLKVNWAFLSLSSPSCQIKYRSELIRASLHLNKLNVHAPSDWILLIRSWVRTVSTYRLHCVELTAETSRAKFIESNTAENNDASHHK